MKSPIEPKSGYTIRLNCTKEEKEKIQLFFAKNKHIMRTHWFPKIILAAIDDAESSKK
jgi:hypothetical protein